MNAPLAEMLRYNRWATLALLEACHPLTDVQLAAHEPGTSGPIGELLLHIVGAQQTFALRTRGRQHEGEFSRKSDWPGIDALIAAADTSAGELVATAESLDTDSDVDLTYMGKTYRFPKSFFLVHAVEHGVEHRTEVKVALARVGIESPDLDGWSYAAARGLGAPVSE